MLSRTIHYLKNSIPGTRTSHRILCTENEGVVLLLESCLFGLGDAWVDLVPAGAGVTLVLLHRVGHFSYQESRYTDSSSCGFRSRSRGSSNWPPSD